MNKLLTVGAVIAVSAGCRAWGATERVRLAENGRAKAVIVVAKDADKAARFGAQDLAWHLRKITGADFAVAEDDAAVDGDLLKVNVGPTKFSKAKRADFRGQQFLVDVRKDGIDLCGLDKEDKGKPQLTLDDDGCIANRPDGKGGQRNWPGQFDAKGTMYAVYEFLENVCGVRWFDAGDYGSVYPKDASLAVECRRLFKEPFLRYRGGAGLDGMSAYEPHVWAKKECLRLEFPKAFAAKDDNFWRNQRILFGFRSRTGGDKGEANHSFNGWYDRFWEKNERNPWAWAGERRDFFAKGYEGRPPQLCYSNPEVVKQAIADGVDYLKNGGYPVFDRKTGAIRARNPLWGTGNFCLEMMDNSSYCKCDECRRQYEGVTGKGRSSKYWFTFVNKVAKELKKAFPDKTVTTLAYGDHEAVPEGVRLEDNVMVYFCLSENRTMFDAKVDEHPQFRRMVEWRRAYPDQPMAIWFYNTFPDEHYRGMGIKGVPGFFAHKAAEQYRFLKRLNARGGVFHCGFNGEVDNYLQLKWMVDPDRDVDAMLAEYFASYGRAGEWLRKFYDLVEERYSGGYQLKSGQPLGMESCWGHMVRGEHVAKLGEYVEKALAAAETPGEKARVMAWKLAVWDYMKEGYDAYAVRAATPPPAWTAKKIPAGANGDPDRVDWSKVELIEAPMYEKGGKVPMPFRNTVRFANDGEWLYMELHEHIDASKLVNSAMITCNDETEVNISLQRAAPHRVWMSAPDGRMLASSFHEINWRWNVSSLEHGCPLFGANYRSDLSDGWRMRWAWPFRTMSNAVVKPGDTVYVNATSVIGDHLYENIGWKRGGKIAICTLSSFTSVHSPDRAAAVTIER